MISELKSDSSSKRDENSLHTLTRKFIKMIRRCPDFHINITQAAEALGVGKRRIYDITNVLEGVGLVSKWSVNSVKWIGCSFEEVVSSDSGDLEFANMIQERNSEAALLDADIERLQNEIEDLSLVKSHLDNAYVTYDDLQKLKIFQTKLVFALKAPSESVMEYPRYDKGLYRLKIMAEQGQISVYYVCNEK